MTPEITGRAVSLLAGTENRKGRFKPGRKTAPSLNVKTIWRVYSMSFQNRLKNTSFIAQTYRLAGKSFQNHIKNIALIVQVCLHAGKSFQGRIRNILQTYQDYLLTKMSITIGGIRAT